MFYLRHTYKSYLNALVELKPNPYTACVLFNITFKVTILVCYVY